MPGSKNSPPWCNHVLLGVAVLWAQAWMVSGNIAGQESCEDGTLGLVQSKTLKAVNVHPEQKAEQDGDDGKEGQPTDVALIIQNETAAQEGRHDQLEESQDENAADEALAMIEELEALFEQAVKKLTGEVTETWKSHDSNKDGFIDDSELPEKNENGGPHEMKVKMEDDGRVSVADCIEAEVSYDLDYLQNFTLHQMAPSVAQLGDPSLTLEDLEKDLSKIRKGSLSVAHLLQRSLPAASEIQMSPEQNLLRSANAPTLEMSDDQDKESEILVEATSHRRRDMRRRVPPPKKPQTAEEIEWGCQDKTKNKNSERCKQLEEVANWEAWGSVQLMLKLMTESDFCWRKHYDRGAGWARICKPGYHQHGALCYKDCRSGYTKVGDHCWQWCPSGFGDWGVACCRWTGWWGLSLECKNKGVYYQPPGTLYSSWSKCPDARPVDVGGMCYKHPEPGYSCTVTACNEDCKGIFSTNCGAAACSSSTASCVKGVGQMITGTLKAMVDTALLIATGGASAGAKVAATAAARTAAKNAARKNIKRMAARIGSRAFKETWIQLALRNARARLKNAQTWTSVLGKWFMGKSLDTVKSSAQDHAKFVAMEYYVYTRLGDEQSMMNNGDKGKIISVINNFEKVTKQNAESDLANFGSSLVDAIDFFGVKDLVQKVGDPSTSPAEEAAAWLSVFSNFDPTGWLSAAANFAKPICAEQDAAMKAAADSGKTKSGGAKSRNSGGSSGGSSGGRGR